MDPYEILGVAHDATEEEIKIAYRKLAKQYHPDTNLDDTAREKMYRINKAYEILQRKDTEEETWDYMGYSFDKQNTVESYTPGRRRLLQNPVFQRVILLLMIGSMLAINIVAAFFRAGSA